MVGSDENDAGVFGAFDLPRGSRAIGGKTTAEILECYKTLSAIDGNIVPGEPHPSDVHKRSTITEKNASVAKKNPKISVHHPTNREYASLIASEQQPISKETKNSIIVDVDDYKAKSYTSLSMYLQQTDAKLEENDQMDDGVEMEYFEEYLIAKIDCPDKKDALAVADYADDIHAFYKRTESLSCVSPDYMNLQPDINEMMRAILINWLIEVHHNFGLIDETLYLTVNLIDRFLAVEPVLREKLQLVGVTAMLLACKYEEVYIPAIEDFLKISGMAYRRKEVLDMEQSMINTLQFNLSVPTPYAFMWWFLKAAQSDKKLECMSFFILELCLVNYQMLRFPPSQLAAAAIYTAECTLTGWKHWTKTCEKYTNYTEDQLLECSKLMVNLHQNAGSGELTGVHTKYSTYKFGHAAKYAPAFFLLDA